MNTILLYCSIALFIALIITFIKLRKLYAIGLMFLALHIVHVKLPQEYTNNIPDVFPLFYILIAICLIIFSKMRGEFKIGESARGASQISSTKQHSRCDRRRDARDFDNLG